MEEQIKVIWVGPTGVNRLGTVTRGEEKEMSISDYDYFKSLSLIEDIKTEPMKRKKPN